MIFRPQKSDNEEEDFFDTPHQMEESKPKGPKPKDPTPDDPLYYEREDEWEHLRTSGRNYRFWGALIAFGLFIGVLAAIYMRYFTPYEEQIVQYGYIESITKRGYLFKTFEGVFLPYQALNDTVTPYPGDLIITAKNDHVAAELLKLRLGNLPARIMLERYHGALPWRGESVWVVADVDTADVTKIYPAPDRHPLIPAPAK